MLWKPASVEETPEIALCDWQVFEVSSELWPIKTRHFVGFNLTEGFGRVSSKIVQFDPKLLRGITRSGRVYELVGEPGYGSADGRYVWDVWCARNQITEIVDVTDEIVRHRVAEA